MSAPIQDSLKVETETSAVGFEASETHLSDAPSPTGSSSSDVSEVNTKSLRSFTISIWPETDFNEATCNCQLTGWGLNTRADADQPSVDPEVTKSVHSAVSEEVARAMASIVKEQEFTKAVKQYTHTYRLRFEKPTVTTRAASGRASAKPSSTRAIQYRALRQLKFAKEQLPLTRTALVGRAVASLNKQVGKLETSLQESSVAESDCAGSGPPYTYRLCFEMGTKPEGEAASTAFVTTVQQPPVPGQSPNQSPLV